MQQIAARKQHLLDLSIQLSSGERGMLCCGVYAQSTSKLANWFLLSQFFDTVAMPILWVNGSNFMVVDPLDILK